MFDGVALADSPVPYLVVLGLVALDAVLPIAPSETLVVAAGVLVEAGTLSLPPVIAAAAGGALIGHSLLFALGTGAGGPIRRRFVERERGEDLERATTALRERTWLLIVADFVPAGRTVAMFAAGVLRLSVRRFFAFVVPGALLWASFYAGLGLLGGATFEREWQAFVASIAMALVIAVVAETALRRGRSGGANQ